MREQFQQEAQTLANLHHPALVQVSDFFTSDGRHYLVMDYVAGESLEARIGRRGALSIAEAGALAGQILDALAYIHGQGIFHRDIKPANIIIREDGSPVLVDFGLVKRWEPRDPATQTIVEGMESPGYTPPEQYSGAAGHTDARSDLYSLGATLYHALSAQLPPSATARMAQPSLLRPLPVAKPDVPEGLDAVIRQAMALPMEERFHNAIAMKAALQSSLDPVRPREQGRPWPWLAGLLLALGFAAAIWLGRADRANQAPLAPQAGVLAPPATEVARSPESDVQEAREPAGQRPATISVVPVVGASPSPPPATPTSVATNTATPAPTATPTPSPRAVGMLAGATRQNPLDGATLIYIPAGPFIQGLNDSQVDRLLERCGGWTATRFSHLSRSAL